MLIAASTVVAVACYRGATTQAQEQQVAVGVQSADPAIAAVESQLEARNPRAAYRACGALRPDSLEFSDYAESLLGRVDVDDTQTAWFVAIAGCAGRYGRTQFDRLRARIEETCEAALAACARDGGCFDIDYQCWWALRQHGSRVWAERALEFIREFTGETCATYGDRQSRTCDEIVHYGATCCSQSEEFQHALWELRQRTDVETDAGGPGIPPPNDP